ncbi:hypothetical protein SAMN05421854_102489 [Amycolatopsis rubida]|uniref:Uncharacterized protein n=1 Tax=Amycolatopsis rubida TaxID=112413 RepID=A0A1I5IJ96_9PSEU|nr:hypothetical protein SAMN05421854_102489 [Amycolatopsis rubida]
MCQANLEAHGRKWQCDRHGAKKYNGMFCGRCASMMKRCFVISRERFGLPDEERHSALCKSGAGSCDLRIREEAAR